MKKRRQHYVWQYYLKPFCYQDKMVYCLIGNIVKGISTKDIAVEKDIYRLKELSASETEWLMLLFSAKDSDLINNMNRGWIQTFNKIFEYKKMFNGRTSEEINKIIDDLEQNLCEDLHMGIESSGSIFLNYLYKEDLTFLITINYVQILFSSSWFNIVVLRR